MTASLLGFAAVLLLCMLRIPIAIAMGLTGFIGFALVIDNWDASFAQVAQIAFRSGLNYGLSVVPLFILMGNLVSRARISDDLFAATNAFVGHRRGGLAYGTVLACGGFSALCGSSVATAATMAKVAMPPMRRYGYADSLAIGSITAGGTLGILIPPSVVLVIYGILTDTSIGKLFAAGLLPGLLAILLYGCAIWAVTARSPETGPPGTRSPKAERRAALIKVWPVATLFILVMGGIYAGIFTPTEAAGIGAVGAFLLALLRRALSLRIFLEVVEETALTTASLIFVLIGALIFANFVNAAGLPQALSELVSNSGLPHLATLWIILGIYLVLGCVFESLSMVLLTVPVFFPVVQGMGYDLVWFGIVVVCVTELGLITPPIGLNIFVVRGTLPDVGTYTIMKGVMPFVAADIVRLAIIATFPILSLLLPNALF